MAGRGPGGARSRAARGAAGRGRTHTGAPTAHPGARGGPPEGARGGGTECFIGELGHWTRDAVIVVDERIRSTPAARRRPLIIEERADRAARTPRSPAGRGGEGGKTTSPKRSWSRS